MTTRILFVLTSHATLGSTGKPTGAFLAELTHPYDVLAQAGVEVDLVTIAGGNAPLDGVNRNDAINARYLDDASFMQQLASTPAVADVDATRYDAVFLAGGHGTMWDLPESQALAVLLGKIYDRGGVVGAVCHGPAGLVNVKLANGEYLVAGKRVAAFTNAEEDAVGLSEVVPFMLADELVRRGATHVPAENWKAHVVVDERLVTGQNPASAAGVATQMLAVLAR